MNLNSADKDPDPASAPDPGPAPDPSTASDLLGGDIANNSGEQHPVPDPKVISHSIGLSF